MHGTHADDFRVTIHESDLDTLAGLVMRYPDRETGGNLFGFWTHSGFPAVQLILGPGPGARHETMAFFQDVSFMATQGTRAQTAFGLQHIGDWHSHHTLGLAEPSRGDVQTILRTLDTCGFARFVALIATVRLDQTVHINAFLFETGFPAPHRGTWVILPGSSPIGEAARERGVTDAIDRTLPARWSVDRTPSRTAAPAAGWYTGRWGTDFVRAFDAQCRRTFKNCRMAAGPRPGELFYTFDHGGAVATIAFSPEFPANPPTIVLAGRELVLGKYRSHLSYADLAHLLVRTVLDVIEGVRDGLEHAAAEEA